MSYINSVPDNAWDYNSRWYRHPLADWCRRTKIASPHLRPRKFFVFTDEALAPPVEQQPAIWFYSADGETWALKEIKFNWAGRIVLWLFGFRRTK